MDKKSDNQIKKLYISGKVTGTDDYLDRFKNAETDAKKLYPGFEVINPVEICAKLPTETSWANYMRVCLKALSDCTHIMMLDGWRDSKGACIEYMIAEEKGMIFV